MKIQDLNGKRVAIIGYAREGRAMHHALGRYAPTAKVTVCDQNEALTLEEPGATRLGASYLDGLDTFDVIIKSSGVTTKPEFTGLEARITSMTEIFFDTIAGSGVTTIGITGSKGKSTTSTLIYEALRAAYGDNVFLMGNIGIPVIDFLDNAKRGHYFVIEMSSFQLENMRVSPHIAVITSFFSEHLDRYGSVEAYWHAKEAICAYQTKEDVVFYNAAYQRCRALAELSPGLKIGFLPSDFPALLKTTKFNGEHNLSNLASAYLVAQHMGVDDKVALKALQQASPLPYRLEPLGTHAGINWVNDSFATAPDATIAGLQALDAVATLITGGMDRGGDYTQLGKEIARRKELTHIILFPDTGAKIKAAIEAAAPHTAKNYFETSNMQAAVAWAASHTPQGATCLLSSASPSFNLFKDFVHRGDAFTSAVHDLDTKNS